MSTRAGPRNARYVTQPLMAEPPSPLTPLPVGARGMEGHRSSVCRCAKGAALLCAMTVMMSLGGCGAMHTNKGSGSAPAEDAIERTADKGPVKLFVRVSPRKPRLSDLVMMDVRVESQPGIEIRPPAFGQAVGDFLIRDYSEPAPEAGARTCTAIIISWSQPTPAST